MKETQRSLRNGTLAVLVSACMLLCVLSPAIIDLNEDGAFASEPVDDGTTYKYVSLGDSMVNAFGSADYYYLDEESKTYMTCLGFLQDDTFSYTVSLAKEYLPSLFEGTQIDFKQFAVGGFRSEEVRAILYDDYQQDHLNGAGDLNNRISDALRSPNVPADVDTKEEFIDYFRSNLVDADLITYQYTYGIGTALSAPLMALVDGGDMPEFDFSRYLGEEFVAIAEYVFDIVYDKLISSIGDDLPIDESMMDLVIALAQGAAYGVIGHCANFNAIMSWLHEIGHDGETFDGKVIVVDSYNNYDGVIFDINGLLVPFGDIVGLLMDVANTYTRYFSPWSIVTSHVALEDDPDMMYDEFLKDVPSDDAKRVFLQSLFNLLESFVGKDNAATYLAPIYRVDKGALAKHDNTDNMTLFVEKFLDSYNELDKGGALTELLEYVFSAKSLDFFGVLNLIGNANETFMNLVGALGMLRSATGDQTVSVVSNDSGGCDVVLEDDAGTSRISFNSVQLSLIFLAMNVLSGDNPMSHPSASGHEYMYNEITKEGGIDAPFDPSFIVPAIMESEMFYTILDQIYDFTDDPLEGFLNITKEGVIEVVNEVLEDSTFLLDDILEFDMASGNPQIAGTKYEFMFRAVDGVVTPLIASLLASTIEDFIEYKGDSLTLRFNPQEAYDEVYFGGVFSAFDDDKTNDGNIRKGLPEIFSGITAEEKDTLKDVELVHISSTSGNTSYLGDEFAHVAYAYMTGNFDDLEPMDYSVFSGYLGEDVTDMINGLRDVIAQILASELSGIIVDENLSKAISVVLDRLTYAYVGSFISTLGLIDMVESVNTDASIIVYGAYNELRGVDINLGNGAVLPIGDIIDKIHAAYDILIYTVCEMKDNVAFVEVAEATTGAFGTVIDASAGIQGGLLSLFVLISKDSNIIPNKEVFTDGLKEWLVVDNAKYKITWVTFDGTRTDLVNHGDMPVYGEVTVPTGTDSYIYRFGGWDKEVKVATGPATYTAIYDIAPSEVSSEGSVTIDSDAFDKVTLANVVTDSWSVQIPSVIFDGMEGDVTISINVLDRRDVPSNIQQFTGDRDVIILGMTVGGTALSDFGENSVKVSVNYTPGRGDDMSNISIFWVDEVKLEVVEYPAYYDADTGKVIFDTTHFSYWFVDEKTVENDDKNALVPYVIALLAVIATLCVVLLKMRD